MRISWKWPILIAAMAWPAVAAADPIVVSYDSRLASAEVVLQGHFNHNAESMGDDLSAEAGTHSDTASGAARATLLSDLSDPRHITASGTAGASLQSTNPSERSQGVSQLYVGFDLDRTYQFSFDGFFASRDHTPSGDFGIWDTALSRQPDPYQSPEYVFNHRMYEAGTVNETGTLAPGRWFLQVKLFGNATGGESMDRIYGSDAFQVGMDLTPVGATTPEPASLFLLGTGLLGLFGSRGRQRRAR